MKIFFTDPTLEPIFGMKELSYTSESAINRFFRHFSIRVDPAAFRQAPSLDYRWGVQKFWILQENSQNHPPSYSQGHYNGIIDNMWDGPCLNILYFIKKGDNKHDVFLEKNKQNIIFLKQIRFKMTIRVSIYNLNSGVWCVFLLFFVFFWIKSCVFSWLWHDLSNAAQIFYLKSMPEKMMNKNRKKVHFKIIFIICGYSAHFDILQHGKRRIGFFAVFVCFVVIWLLCVEHLLLSTE